MASGNELTKAYAAKAKDPQILQMSASGGMFTVLSDLFLNNGDAVVGCIFHVQTKTAQLQLITDKDQRDRARSSKYMQSQTGTVYQDSIRWLRENPDGKLLFTGLGCQAAAFRKITDRMGFSDRVLIVDIICHGVPSGKLWKEYITDIEKKYKTSLQSVNFRDKRTGWAQSQAIATFADREINMKDFMRVYFDNLIIRPSCYCCPYATVSRNSDITVGDFWHIEKVMPDFVDPRGNSLVLIQTEKGHAYFNEISDQIDFCPCDITQCLQINLQHPTEKPAQREAFWRDYTRRGIGYVIEKYGHITFFKRVKRKLRKLFS